MYGCFLIGESLWSVQLVLFKSTDFLFARSLFARFIFILRSHWWNILQHGNKICSYWKCETHLNQHFSNNTISTLQIIFRRLTVTALINGKQWIAGTAKFYLEYFVDAYISVQRTRQTGWLADQELHIATGESGIVTNLGTSYWYSTDSFERVDQAMHFRNVDNDGHIR